MSADPAANTTASHLLHQVRIEEQLRHTEEMIALGELVAGVAHAINNPLTEDQRESVQVIKQEADRAKHIIDDLLRFSRKTGRGSGPARINDVLAQTVRLRAYPLRNAGVAVMLDLDPANSVASTTSARAGSARPS